MEKFGKRIGRAIKAATLAGVILLHPENTVAETTNKTVETKTKVTEPARPPIKKESPQRTAYDNIENFTKYADEIENKASVEYKKKKDELESELKELERKGRKVNASVIKKLRLQEDEEKQKNIKDFIEKTKKHPENLSILREKIDKAFAESDKQREWMANVVHSPDYRRKAIREGVSPKEIEERKKRSTEREPTLADNLNPLLEEGSSGFSNDETGQYIVGLDEASFGAPITIHELGHSTTNNRKGMSEYAKKLYAKASTQGEFVDNYSTSPTELDARKKVFEYELEKFGIWKYGEKFTEEHLKKALELKEQGKLSRDSGEFLDYLIHEKIPKIMNTIAKNNLPGTDQEVRT